MPSSLAGVGTVWRMVTSLRQRIAIAVLVGVMVIPLLMSSLGGIGQLLACESVVAQPFSVTPTEGGTVVASSRVLDRPADAAGADDAAGAADDTAGTDDAAGDVAGPDETAGVAHPPGAAAAGCAGVTADIAAELVDEDTVRLVVTIANASDLPWRGSIGLRALGDQVDADLTTSLGRVPAGAERSDDLLLRVPDERTEIAGRVLLGP